MMEPNTVYDVSSPNDRYIQMLCPDTGVFVAYLTAASSSDHSVYIVNPDGDEIAELYSYGDYGGYYGNLATLACLNGLWAVSYNYM